MTRAIIYLTVAFAASGGLLLMASPDAGPVLTVIAQYTGKSDAI